MKPQKLTLFLLVALLLSSCGDSFKTAKTGVIPGVFQKGPYQIGSPGKVICLTDTLGDEGNGVYIETTDSLGSVNVSWGDTCGRARVEVYGTYFDENTGKLSDGPMLIKNLVDLYSDSQANGNIVTHMGYERARSLFRGGMPLAQARIQATKEVFAAFGFSVSADANQMALSDATGDGAALMLVSATIIEGRTALEAAGLAYAIGEDLKEDGSLDSATLNANISQSASRLNLADIQNNMANHFGAQGFTSPDLTVAMAQMPHKAPAFSLSSISGSTTESGDKTSFQVVLKDLRPQSDVTLNFSQSDSTEGSLVASTLFTPNNWNSAQTIEITGLDDSLTDGDQTYEITITSSSADPLYNNLQVGVLKVTNKDNESAGVLVGALSGDVSESGLSSTFSVKLTSPPSAPVTFKLSSNDLTEATVNPAQLVFTDTNWNGLQTVTVSGVNDNFQDGPQSVTILLAPAASSDPTYNGLDPRDITLKNLDDDSAGFVVGQPSRDTSENRAIASFPVSLTAQPDADVTIKVVSDNKNEGEPSLAKLTFTPDNWATAQTITVIGQDDDMDDGDVTYHILLGKAVSDDGSYQGLDPIDVTLKNIDNDRSGFTLTAPLGAVSEAGTSTTFTIVLNSKPTADVMIAAASSDLSEGRVDTGAVFFSQTNWSTPQTLRVTGLNDGIIDGNQSFQVILANPVSNDGSYAALTPNQVTLVNTDDDTAGFVVTSWDTQASEFADRGNAANAKIRLTKPPQANVNLAVWSGNSSEISLSRSQITFTPANWDLYQDIFVAGVDDGVFDGTRNTQVLFGASSSSDPNYHGLTPASQSISVLDEGVINSPSSCDQLWYRQVYVRGQGIPASSDIPIGALGGNTASCRMDYSGGWTLVMHGSYYAGFAGVTGWLQGPALDPGILRSESGGAAKFPDGWIRDVQAVPNVPGQGATVPELLIDCAKFGSGGIAHIKNYWFDLGNPKVSCVDFSVNYGAWVSHSCSNGVWSGVDNYSYSTGNGTYPTGAFRLTPTLYVSAWETTQWCSVYVRNGWRP